MSIFQVVENPGWLIPYISCIIIYSTHIMNLVEEMSDRIILLMEGRIIFMGGLNEIYSETGATSLENAISMLVDKNGE